MTGMVRHFAPCGDSLAALMAYVCGRAADLKLPHQTSLRLQLVAEELFTNTFRHAPCPEGGPAVTVGIEPAGTEVELRYEDGEPEWNPLQQSATAHLTLPLEQRPVGGLGSLLIGSLAQRAEYERVEGRNRVRVWLRWEAGGA